VGLSSPREITESSRQLRTPQFPPGFRPGGKEPNVAKGYIIFSETTRDQAGFQAYVDKAVPTLLQAGGRPIIFHEGPEVLEGTWPHARIVVAEFDSVEAARKWYHSPEYQAVIGERHASADADAILVAGMD
jgi:uncharacterized protein (DUF1330 family)